MHVHVGTEPVSPSSSHTSANCSSLDLEMDVSVTWASVRSIDLGKKSVCVLYAGMGHLGSGFWVPEV